MDEKKYHLIIITGIILTIIGFVTQKFFFLLLLFPFGLGIFKSPWKN